MFERAYDAFGIPHERGMRLWAELTYYIVRDVLCANPNCGCIKCPKLMLLINHWPSVPLLPNERDYLLFIGGLMANDEQQNAIAKNNIDLSKPVEESIQVIYQAGMQYYQHVQTAIQEKYN